MMTNRFSDDLTEAGVLIGSITNIMILWFTAQFVLYVIAFAYWFNSKPKIAVFVGIATILILGVLSVYERRRYNRRRWFIRGHDECWALVAYPHVCVYIRVRTKCFYLHLDIVVRYSDVAVRFDLRVQRNSRRDSAKK